jgi:hypothetical protein
MSLSDTAGELAPVLPTQGAINQLEHLRPVVRYEDAS